MSRIKELEKLIEKSANAYYNGAEIISDDEYDALVYELSSLDPKNAKLAAVGAEASNEWKKEKHLYPLGSLNKVNFPNEMEDWISKTLNNKPCVVVDKLDGLSIGCEYEDGILTKALLRGNGLEGENILSNVLKMKGVVKKLPKFTGTVRGEIVLTKPDHKQYFPEYANPRNAASGLCRRFDGEGSQHLTLMMYDVMSDKEFETEEDKFTFLHDNNFRLPFYTVCKSAKEVNNLWQTYQDKTRATLDYEIDGLVVSCNEISVQQALGEHNLRPKGKLAFKFANQFVKTTLKECIWTVGNSGRITPVCTFEKVNLLGSNIEKASVYNLANVESLGLGPGAEVLVCKANEIIPRIEKVVKKGASVFKAPVKCPSCDSKLSMYGEYLTCDNRKECVAQIIGSIKNWVSELNILELGEGLIEKLVESGLVKTPADLYKLTVKDMAELDRMGEKSAQNVYNSLWKNNPVTLDLFLGALSMQMIGSSTIRLLMEAGYDSLDKIYTLTEAQIIAVNGIGPVKAGCLINGLVEMKPVIEQLLENGVKIKEKIVGKLTGAKIAITGSTKNKRAYLENFIINNGGENKSSVGKSCTHLVIADVNSTSSKAVTAKKLKIKLITEEDLLNLAL